MHHKLRTALGFTIGDWAALAAAWCCLVCVDLGLRSLSFSRLIGLIDLAAPAPKVGAPPDDVGARNARPERMARMVRIAAAHHLYQMNCLRQALALRWLLAQRGLATELKIGVQKGRDGLAAHAWVELGGSPLGEAADIGNRYLPLTAATARA